MRGYFIYNTTTTTTTNNNNINKNKNNNNNNSRNPITIILLQFFLYEYFIIRTNPEGQRQRNCQR